MKNLKSKSLLTMLMVLALLVATASMAFASFDAFLVKADDGKFYEYNSEELNDSYTAFQVLGATSPQAAMYNQFVAIGGSTKVVALNDSVKGWMDYAAASAANIAAQLADTAFVINDYFATPAATLYGGTVTNPIVVNPDGTLTPTVDLAAYEAAVAQANAAVQADYTAATWAALQTALTDNVVTDANTQAEIDAATTAINAAIAGLEEVLRIANVEAVNANRLAITFNKAIEDADDIEKDGNRIVVYDAARSAKSPNSTSTVITFSQDKKSATVILGTGLATGSSYTTALVDNNTTPALANVVVASSPQVLIKGIDTPGADLNKDQNKIVLTFSKEMNNATLTAANYSVYDSNNSLVVGALSNGTWVDSTTKKAVELPIVAGKLSAGKTYKVIVNTTNVKTADGTELPASQKTFSVSTPSVAAAKPKVKLAQVTGTNEIKITFDRDVTDSSVANSLISVKSGSKVIVLSGPSSTLTSNVLTITTTTELEAGKSYTVELPANFAINSLFLNAANDAISTTITTPGDVSVQLMTAQFVRQTDDKMLFDLVLTFDQPVKGTSAQGLGDVVINASGISYDVNATTVEMYTTDATGKSLVIKDVATHTTAAFTAEIGKNYEIVAKSGTIETNSPGSTKTNTKDLKATAAGIDVSAPQLDEVTSVSAEKITVKFDETIDASALTAGDIQVKGFVKAINGSAPTPETLSGTTQIKFSVSGDTLTIEPANSAIKFVTGDVGGAVVADMVKIAADKIKDSNGILDTTGFAVDSDAVTDNSVPMILSAVATNANTLEVTYTEDSVFKDTDVDKEASQFAVSGVKTNQSATAASFTNNVLTLTLTDSFEAGKDYSSATLSYTRNINYRVEDAVGNQADNVTFTGLKAF